ncbi:MAG: protein-disulfide reductase DsbD family protein [Paracoccaceae bacterium]|nr:protein-disulfide reductase DsbD family protein [Paracoccaceae bacterium]
MTLLRRDRRFSRRAAMLQWAGIVPSLVPTRLTIAGNEVPAPTYPRPLVKTLRFSDTPLALYEGVVDLAAKVPPNDGTERPPMAELTLQACSDRICLDPQKMRFALC